MLNYYYISPLHKPSFEAHGTDFIQPGKFVGNGAYVMKELVPQSHVLLVKNPNYRDAAGVQVESIKYVTRHRLDRQPDRLSPHQVPEAAIGSQGRGSTIV
jgi:oligopeptide transport system substrate-binding protein